MLVIFQVKQFFPSYSKVHGHIKVKQFISRNIYCPSFFRSHAIFRRQFLLSKLILKSRIFFKAVYQIWCYPMHPLFDALPLPSVPVLITRPRRALVAHILMRLHAAEPCSSTGPLFSSQCHCGTILLTVYSMMWDCRVSRAGPMLFLLFYAAITLFVLYIFHLIFFLSICRQCEAVVFGLIEYKSLSPSLALSTYFNSNNNRHLLINAFRTNKSRLNYKRMFNIHFCHRKYYNRSSNW